MATKDTVLLSLVFSVAAWSSMWTRCTSWMFLEKQRAVYLKLLDRMSRSIDAAAKKQGDEADTAGYALLACLGSNVLLSLTWDIEIRLMIDRGEICEENEARLAVLNQAVRMYNELFESEQ
jgi:hypothetical protein